MISTSRSTTDAAATPNDAVYKKVSQERKMRERERKRGKNKTRSYMNNMEKGEQALMIRLL